MEIYFKSKAMGKTMNSKKAIDRAWGTEIGKKIRQRLFELQAADNLSQIGHLPPARCHLLTGNLDGCFSVDLRHPYRLLFKPANDPIPLAEDGGIDKSAVTIICILEVTNTHE